MYFDCVFERAPKADLVISGSCIGPTEALGCLKHQPPMSYHGLPPSSPDIAVYTYNLGGYEEPRGFQVPCVARREAAPLVVPATEIGHGSGKGCLPSGNST